MNEQPVRARRVLVVDDDALLRKMIAKTLRHAGWDVTDVGSGEVALARFAAQPHDLVLLDLEMPGFGGADVCDRLRASAAGARVPIVIVSGRDDADTIAATRRRGATDFIVKPIDWAGLNERLDDALGPRGDIVPPGIVLLAGASAELARIGAWLAGAGAIISAVADGREAVESALRRDFDLVVMDVEMATMDGVAATALLRACGCRQVIVALASADATAQRIDACRTAGSDDVVCVPVDGERLHRIVARHRAGRDSSMRHAANPALERERVAHAKRYRLGLPLQMATIRAALAAGRWPELTTLMHTLKGTAGSFGLRRLTDLAEAIEAELRVERTAGVAQLCAGLFRETDLALAGTDEEPE